MKKIYKRLLVTGTMRVGTTWMTKALWANDIDCQHECMGEDGSVSWFFSIDAPSYPYNPHNAPARRTAHVGEGRRNDYEFGTVVHLIRDPLKTIGSMVSIMTTHEQQWLVDNGVIESMECKPKLLRMMQAWYNQNTEVETIADMRFRLEDLVKKQELWDKLGRSMKTKLTLPDIGVRNASRGIFKARIFVAQDLVNADKTLANNIFKKARRYGYDY